MDELDSLYRKYSCDVLKYLRRMFGPGPPDPEDVVQITFEKYAMLKAPDRVENACAFLMRTARNYVVDHHRSQVVRTSYAREVQSIGTSSEDLHAERILESRQRLALLDAAIAKLDGRSREILLLSRIHGLSSAEIARRKGCSATLVKAIIARALVACHQALAEPTAQ